MSRKAVSRRDPARRARAVKRWVASILVLPALFVFGIVNASSAAAQWRTNAAASMRFQSGTLARPVGVTVPGSAWFFVSVSWSPGAGTVTPAGYYVTRTSGTTTTAACDSSPTTLLSGTSCSDSWVPSGTYTYVVTAVYRTWTSASLPSAKVSVRGLFGLDFVQQPSTVDATGGTTVSVQLVDDAGASAKAEGVPVTLQLTADAAGATQAVDPRVSTARAAGALVANGFPADVGADTPEVLATVETDARGIARFEDVPVDASPGDYVLTATSPGLEPAISDEFTVVTPAEPSGGTGSADPNTYAVLAAHDITSTGTTSATGNVGAAGSVTGLEAASVHGDLTLGDAARGALDAFAKDFAVQAARTPDAELPAALRDATLAPGVRHAAGTLDVSGTLTLDAAGDPDASFVIQAAALKTAAGTAVRLANGARARNVTWVVAGEVEVGADCSLAGRLIAGGAIGIQEGTTLFGQAWSQGSVALARTKISAFDDAETIIVVPENPTTEPTPEPTASTEPGADVQPPTQASAAPTAVASPEPTAAQEPEKVDQPAPKKSEPSEPATPPEPPVPATAPEPARTPDPEPPKPVETEEPADG